MRTANNAGLLRRRKNQQGTALIEAALCIGLLWMPLFLGTAQIGFSLIQSIQVTQVCRDSGHMYAYGINFSQTSNQYLLASFAPLLGIDASGSAGTGVVILSTVQYVNSAQCQSGGYASTCPNVGMLVFTNQQIVGNPNLHSSLFGKPVTDSLGNVALGSPSTNGYLNQPSALVSNFPNITLTSSSSSQQYGYIAELYSQNVGPQWLFRNTNWVNSTSFF